MKYSATWSTVTANPVADGSSFNNTTAVALGFLRTGGSTSRVKISEVYIGGEDTGGVVAAMLLARNSLLSVGTLTVGNLELIDALSNGPSSAPAWGNNAGTTYPQRSSTRYLLPLSLNTYGGISKWMAKPNYEITAYGATQPYGDVSLSCRVSSGTPKSSGYILFEAA